ncbi:protease B nonderepressible form [Diaporthe eres]|uniref:Protein PBN1 n=1 Tax=Diaporthe eres TaxID=83184 RepID=A0ABR1P865_DIAER
MRQRITFLHKPEDAPDPSSLVVTDTSLTGPALSAAREDRITLALEELPEELRQVLQSCHELHIRWVSSHPYDTISPLYSRLSPGLHVFFTPRADSTFQDDGQLCAALKSAFGNLDCDTPKTSFTSLPSDRFSHSTAFQYYQPLEDLSVFTKYVGKDLCHSPGSASSSTGSSSCASRVDLLSTASSLDISYDTISHALKVTGTWGFQDQPLRVVAPEAGNHRVEVGILATDKPHGIEPHELGLSGSLTVLGQDKKPAATIFKFPARHRRVDGASFSAGFLQPAGLHPTLQLRLHGAAAAPPDLGGDDGSSHCSLHAHLTLPRVIFADQYQLSDSLFLASKNLTALRYISQPVDLEAPDYALKVWGSAALLELAPPPPKTTEKEAAGWTAEVPLHLRYLSPAPGGYRTAQLPHPAVFWACTTEEGTKFPASPFERVNLGYDGLFGPRTVFWHVDPVAQDTAGGARLLSEVHVPVLDVDRSGWVSAGTAAVVLLGFGWVAWKLLAVYLRTGYGPQQQMEGLEKKKQ